jgi:hypothetical protein
MVQTHSAVVAPGTARPHQQRDAVRRTKQYRGLTTAAAAAMHRPVLQAGPPTITTATLPGKSPG